MNLITEAIEGVWWTENGAIQRLLIYGGDMQLKSS